VDRVVTGGTKGRDERSEDPTVEKLEDPAVEEPEDGTVEHPEDTTAVDGGNLSPAYN